ncbi:MAG: 6-carboxytetrahydropterin synthase QueD [Elusimicrobia bacterium]|nr:6-carboxytetrahydropterin synthase QueD [Elusimicrobiota bacterium]
MYRISVSASFSSAHFLRNYRGKCEKIHGHNWKVILTVESKILKNNMVMDFSELKKILKDVLSKLDHKTLNDIPPFTKENPTSERIAKFIADKIKMKLPSGVKISSVQVFETENSSATYLK